MVDAKRHKCAKPLNNNPYNSPIQKSGREDLVRDTSLSEDSKANLFFAAKIARVLSVGCGLASIYTAYTTYDGVRSLTEIYGGWIWLHYLTLVRGLYIPTLLLFAWVSWRAASSMREIAKIDSGKPIAAWNQHVSNATWVWIGLLLFGVVSLFEISARFSMLYFRPV